MQCVCQLRASRSSRRNQQLARPTANSPSLSYRFPRWQVVDVLAAGGVKFIAMRCAGFDRVRGLIGHCNCCILQDRTHACCSVAGHGLPSVPGLCGLLSVLWVLLRPARIVSAALSCAGFDRLRGGHLGVC